MPHHTDTPQLTRHHLFGDGVVLQRNTRPRIWGWAAPGSAVVVRFLDAAYTATAGADGGWAVRLAEMEAGGPYDMEIETGGDQITVRDILVGDVWLCSGQSNMVLPMARVRDLYEDVITQANNPAIRQFIVPERYDFKTAQRDLQSGQWESVTAESILRFSAVAYFFARALFEKYHVPIGLISASIGGSPIEAWMSEDTLEAFPEYLSIAKKFSDDAYLERIKNGDQAASDAWYAHLDRLDQGLSGDLPWFDPDYDASEWSTVQMPAYWDEAGIDCPNGAVWLRKEVDVPASMAGKPALLRLGRIVDSDFAYVNGTLVGTVSYQYPPRKYDIPDNLLKPGKNIITVRVINPSERGGLIKDKPYLLTDHNETLDLEGEWQYKVGATVEPKTAATMIQCQPLGLFNGMIAPLVGCAMKGVIWYQGETNIGRAGDYCDLFSTLIADWRQKWGQGDFPFLYVQLANYAEADARPAESTWAELREAQLRALAVPNTAMAVAMDMGEWNDVHPLRKREVGERLALAAQRVAYGDAGVVCSGPLFASMRAEDGRIVVSFSNIGSGLAARDGGELRHFAIAGADRRFVWANARIEGDSVIVWSDQVPEPAAVRYAWADNPEGANLYNLEGLPASCFRAG
jgi:sialate O-acetylesterase